MRRWSYLPLRRRVLLSLAGILALGWLVWMLRGYPPLTEEGYLRRFERAHLLPEGRVLTEIDTGSNGPHFLAADGGTYLELCRLPQNSLTTNRSEGFYLYEKMGDLTAVPLPSSIYDGRGASCMILFDGRPEVHSVELTFTVGRATYTTRAEREVGGLILCYYEGVYERDWELWHDPSLAECSAKLYAADGTLIEEAEVPMGKLIL